VGDLPERCGKEVGAGQDGTSCTAHRGLLLPFPSRHTHGNRISIQPAGSVAGSSCEELPAIGYTGFEEAYHNQTI
jgi:hypothetical protein